MAGLNEAEEPVDDGLMNLDFSRICRLCLNFSREFVDLRPSTENQVGARHITDQIKYCYNVKIDLTEPLPCKICFQCIQILTLFSATKRNIKYSEMMLRNILNIRNANHIINSQNMQGIDRFLSSSDDHQREQGPSVGEDRRTQDNSRHLRNLRISPIQMATVRELYRRQNQAMQDGDDQNAQINLNLKQSPDKPTEKKNVENQKTNTENKPVEAKQDDSGDTNSKIVESSLKSKPSCSISTDSTPQEEKVCKTMKTPEEDKTKSTNKKPDEVNNINKKRPILIDRKRDLRVKLEVLDLETMKRFYSISTNSTSGSTLSTSVSTEGQGGGTTGESTSGKLAKEIGTVIDESNILSPKVKRMRKSIPKG